MSPLDEIAASLLRSDRVLAWAERLSQTLQKQREATRQLDTCSTKSFSNYSTTAPLIPRENAVLGLVENDHSGMTKSDIMRYPWLPDDKEWFATFYEDPGHTLSALRLLYHSETDSLDFEVQGSVTAFEIERLANALAALARYRKRQGR